MHPQRMRPQVPSQKHSPLLKKLLTADEVAVALGLTRRGVESMTKRRILPVIKLSGRAVRYSPDAVQSALDRLTVDAIGTAPRK